MVPLSDEDTMGVHGARAYALAWGLLLWFPRESPLRLGTLVDAVGQQVLGLGWTVLSDGRAVTAFQV